MARTEEHWQAGGSLSDVVMELQKEGHITRDQLAAVAKFLRDLKAANGSSAGIVSQVQERVQMSTIPRHRPPGMPSNVGHARTAYVLRHLRDHERTTLQFLICQRELPRGSLADLGRLNSGYKTQKTLRAAATGQVRALLATIAEVYAEAEVRAA